MKKRHILLIAGALLAAACSKEHRCYCTYADGEDAVNALDVLEVGSSISCADITEFAFEEHTTTDDGQQTLHRVNVHKVNCRDYGE